MEKTFSCSNTSKNAVQYITIRTISFISPGSAFRPLPLFWPRFFSGKWRKDKCLFSNHQIFLKEFFRIFSEPFFVSFRTVCCIRSGCKGKSFFWISKGFRNFFSKFFRTCFCRFRAVFLSRSGCKDKDFSRQLPNNSRTFFRQFSRSFYTRLWISELVVKIF